MVQFTSSTGHNVSVSGTSMRDVSRTADFFQIEGDHLCGKPGNVGDFDSCQ